MARAKTSTKAGDEAGRETPAPASDEVDEHVVSAVAKWPVIDPEVEGIVVRIDKIDRLIDKTGMVNLGALRSNARGVQGPNSRFTKERERTAR